MAAGAYDQAKEFVQDKLQDNSNNQNQRSGDNRYSSDYNLGRN